MASTALATIEIDAARYGFRKRLGGNANRHKTVWLLQCSKCPREFSAYWQVKTPPAMMVKNMRRRGWSIGLGDRPLCAACAHPRADHAPNPKPEHQTTETYKHPTPKSPIFHALAKAVLLKPEPKPGTVTFIPNQEIPKMGDVLAQTYAKPPTPGPKISRAVFNMLDDVFDSENCLYKSGCTDQKVAITCGTTEEIVAYLRRETFGELAEDPRITNLREDVELMRMELTDTIKRLDVQMRDLMSRLDQLRMTAPKSR